ncbi:MAG: FAD-dependent oxidoreductase [Pseudomonadota bacterium]
MKIAIIGAGFAGLTLANRLADTHDVSVYEKARGPGGRMSTRRADPFAFDHGAQYFTVETARFEAFLAPFRKSSLIEPWPKEIACVGGARLSEKEKLVATPGMNSLCKALAANVTVQARAHIEQLKRSSDGWILTDKAGAEIGPFDWVISSAPSVQTAALFPITFSGHSALEKTEMVGCFSLMLGFETPLDLPWTALKSGTAPIGWMAVNSSKPGRPAPYSVLIQSENEWGEAHLEDDPDQVRAALISAASEFAGADLSTASHQVMHRWRYAATRTPAGERFLIDPVLQLAACGDWCLGGKVEAAFLSASELADQFESSSST